MGARESPREPDILHLQVWIVLEQRCYCFASSGGLGDPSYRQPRARKYWLAAEDGRIG